MPLVYPLGSAYAPLTIMSLVKRPGELPRERSAPPTIMSLLYLPGELSGKRLIPAHNFVAALATGTPTFLAQQGGGGVAQPAACR